MEWKEVVERTCMAYNMQVSGSSAFAIEVAVGDVNTTVVQREIIASTTVRCLAWEAVGAPTYEYLK